VNDTEAQEAHDTFMAMADFVGCLENLIGLAKQSLAGPPQGGFYVVVVPMTGKATCQSFDNLDDLVAHLRSLHGQEVQVFPFTGTRLRISKGGDYLFSPWGNHALFVANQADEPDEDGFMGVTTQFSPPPSEVVTFDEESEHEDDED
jgi:hypothetical protein